MNIEKDMEAIRQLKERAEENLDLMAMMSLMTHQQETFPQTCEDILIMGGKRILNPAVLFAEHREVHPELRPQGLQVFCDGICHRIRDLPFLLNEKF
ncbi:unnamed protein product [Boreogadus saida]